MKYLLFLISFVLFGGIIYLTRFVIDRAQKPIAKKEPYVPSKEDYTLKMDKMPHRNRIYLILTGVSIFFSLLTILLFYLGAKNWLMMLMISLAIGPLIAVFVFEVKFVYYNKGYYKRLRVERHKAFKERIDIEARDKKDTRTPAIIIIERVLVSLAMVMFAIRFLCYQELQWVNWEPYQKMANIGQGKFFAFFGEICIWLGVVANILLFMRAFTNLRVAKFFVKFVTLPILVVSILFINPMIINMIGETHKTLGEMKLVEYMLPLELGLTLPLALYYFYKDFNVKLGKHERSFCAVVGVLGALAAIPPYLPMFFIGRGTLGHNPYGLSVYHRFVIYIFFIALPLFIYFFLRNKGDRKIRYALLFMSLSIMFSFMYAYKYNRFLEPWTYPWHLCNTAVFILPICLIFKPKRLFYFTYFINVFGAVMATLMPNYAENATMFNPDVVRFILNHILAFSMPLLLVALKVYPRPKLKQYFYSVGWFALYFVLVLALNTYFNAHGHNTDFFFLFTDKIASKLGKFGENIFRNAIKTFEINGFTYTVRPVYQLLFFIGYVIFGFAMWFVYQLGFDISDSHYQLHLKLKGIKQDHIALISALDGRSIKEPMEKDAGITLKLDHFSKKYGSNKHYSVHDVSFEVNAGEVFGFLGPNGAGKSTIIKSIVGIQPITEGKMSVCGYDVQRQPVETKANLGYVPDHYALYEKLTGREYINYIADIFEVSKEERDERMSYYVKLFELEQSIDNKIKTYSHGMKQKITIISALIHEPKIWILDEPLTGLDPTSIYQVKQCMINHAKKGNIVFFSSHLIDIVEKLCDRVGIIKGGELQVVDTVENIEKSGKTLEEFYLSIIGDKVTKAGN